MYCSGNSFPFFLRHQSVPILFIKFIPKNISFLYLGYKELHIDHTTKLKHPLRNTSTRFDAWPKTKRFDFQTVRRTRTNSFVRVARVYRVRWTI